MQEVPFERLLQNAARRQHERLGDKIWELFAQTGVLLRKQGVINLAETVATRDTPHNIDLHIHGYYGTLGDKMAHLHAHTLDNDENSEDLFVTAYLLRRSNIAGARLIAPIGSEHTQRDLLRGVPRSEELPYTPEAVATLIEEVFDELQG